jgi:uncharacterized protein (DUF433 family)
MPTTRSRPLTVTVDPEIHGGDAVFAGTRVPVATFVEHLCGGSSINEFVDHFPSVQRDLAVAFLREATAALIEQHGRESDQV